MTAQRGVGLPEALERAASALPAEADAIRPANGDPARLLEELSPDAAARVLAWLLRHEPADGAELAEAWAESGEAGRAPLLGVPLAGLPREARKALRRAHHRLRSRGVALPSPETRAVRAVLPPVEAGLDEAMVSPLDPRGARAVYCVRSHPSGGVRLFELVVDETRGILECRAYDTGRSRVRRLLKEVGQRGPLGAVAAPPDAVRALLARIAAAQPGDRALPRAFSEWRAQLARAPEDARTPGELAREALGDGAEPARLRDLADRVRAGELGPWPPEEQGLTRAAERIAALGEGLVVVSPEQRREQVDGLVSESCAELFAASFGEQTAARFEETAFVLWKLGREDEARDCLAAARRFREGSPEDNPVARAMLEVLLAPTLARLEGPRPEEAESSRLVRPHP